MPDISRKTTAITRLLAALGLLLLFAGCPYHDPNPFDNDHHFYVRLEAPVNGTLQMLTYEWAEEAGECDWACRKRDSTVFTAFVTADVPGIASAQVYLASHSSNEGYATGPVYYPAADTFSVRLFVRAPGSMTSCTLDTMHYYAWVRVTARDGSRWRSPAVAFRTVGVLLPPVTTVSAPPRLTELRELRATDSTGLALQVTWCDSSPQPRAYILHWLCGFDGTASTDTVSSVYSLPRAGERQLYLPETTYAVWLETVNAFGISPPSDTLTLVTLAPPRELRIRATLRLPDPQVDIEWLSSRQADSMLVARREGAGEWQTIAAVIGHAYTGHRVSDALLRPQTLYTYRVGLQFPNGVWWSTDSVRVSIP